MEEHENRMKKSYATHGKICEKEERKWERRKEREERGNCLKQD